MVVVVVGIDHQVEEVAVVHHMEVVVVVDQEILLFVDLDKVGKEPVQEEPND